MNHEELIEKLEFIRLDLTKLSLKFDLPNELSAEITSIEEAVDEVIDNYISAKGATK